MIKIGRGRKPLSEQKGNLTREIQEKKKYEESLVKADTSNIDTPPSFLKGDKVAIKEYKRLIDELKKLDIITNLDTNNLGSYCVAYSKYVQATSEMLGQPLTIQKQQANGTTCIAEHPLIKIQKLYAEEMRKFSVTLGLTIDSRLKFATAKAEKVNNEIEDKFGGI